MRNTLSQFLTCVFIGALPLIAHGQYLSFNEQAVYHFQNSQNYDAQLPLRIERIEDHIDHRKYYPFQMAQGDLYDCVDVSSFHWIGERMDEYFDGRHLFYPPSGDTILINAFAQTGNTWLASENINSKVFADCESIQLDTFLGITDSVKTFVFTHVDLNGQVIDDDITGLKIRLSKDHGYISMVHFALWPDAEDYIYYNNFQSNVITGFADAGFQNLIWEDVIDFEVGNEIHIYEELSYYGQPTFEVYDKYVIRKFIEKFELGDSVFYRVQDRIHAHTFTFPGPPDTVEYIDTILISYIKSNTNFDMLALVPYDTYDIYTFNLSMQSDFGSGKVYKYKELNPHYSGGPECWAANFDSQTGNVYYKFGGGPYYSRNLFGLTEIRQLLYFKNDSIEIGKPLDSIFSAIHYPVILSNPNSLHIAPNPVDDRFTVSWNPGFKVNKLEVYNAWGQKVHDSKISQEAYFINLKCVLNSGMYLCVLTNAKNQRASTKFLKQ